MLSETWRVWLLIVGLTVVSGVGDAYGFTHAALIWHNGRVLWSEVARSALGFAWGVAVYWYVLKYMTAVGIVAPEMQTIAWFTVTLIGVALISGKFLGWGQARPGRGGGRAGGRWLAAGAHRGLTMKKASATEGVTTDPVAPEGVAQAIDADLGTARGWGTAQVRALAAQQRPIDAVRLYRDRTGASLAEAKAFVVGVTRSAR